MAQAVLPDPVRKLRMCSTVGLNMSHYAMLYCGRAIVLLFLHAFPFSRQGSRLVLICLLSTAELYLCYIVAQ